MASRTGTLPVFRCGAVRQSAVFFSPGHIWHTYKAGVAGSLQLPGFSPQRINRAKPLPREKPGAGRERVERLVQLSSGELDSECGGPIVREVDNMNRSRFFFFGGEAVGIRRHCQPLGDPAGEVRPKEKPDLRTADTLSCIQPFSSGTESKPTRKGACQ